jgi:hypothetical protein
MKLLSSWFGINRALGPAIFSIALLSALLALAASPRHPATKSNSPAATVAKITSQCSASSVFSASFTQGQGTDPAVAQQWRDFRHNLVPANYDTVTIKGTFDSTGRILTDATIVPQIATAMKNATANSWNVGNITWEVNVGCVDSNGPPDATGLYATLNGGPVSCVCTDSSSYMVRPEIGASNSNWGGVNTVTCNAPSQSLTVIFSNSISPCCAPAPASMIAWWKAEGDAKDSQGNHDGTNNGATFTPGEVGNAFTFDGTDDSISIPPSTDWNFGTGDFTFDFWAISNDSIDRMHALSFEPDPTFATNNLDFNFNDSGVGLFLFWNGGGGNSIQVGNTGDYTNGQWHHFALTRSGSTFTLYIEGVAVGTANYTGAVDLSGGNNNYIGASTGQVTSSRFFWNGQVDEVEIFNRALSATDVANIYAAGSAGKCPCTPPPNNLVSWWPGDGGTDDIQGGNDGTFVGNPAYASGEVHQAFSFDGASASVNVPNSPSLNVGGQLTIDFWIKGDASNSFSGNQGLVATDFYGLEIENGPVAFYTSTTNGNSFSIASASISTNAWHHIAGTYDGSNINLYVDGVLQATAPQSGNISPMLANSFLTIGSEDGRSICPSCVGTRYFNGNIDEVEIFNRALTAAEVLSIYNAGGAGKCRSCVPAPGGLISWWKGDGNTRDAQANNNGTFNGTPAYGTGEVGQAFSFDGNVANYVSIPPAASLDLAKFSVDAWANPTTSSGVRYILVKEPPASNSSNYYLALIDGNLVEFGYQPGQYQFVDSTIAVPVNAWSHITGTYDGTTLKLYINGALNATTNANPSFLIPPFGQPLSIGSRTSNNTDAFVGLIDEVEIFGRALSDGEVHKIYDGGSHGKCPCVNAPNNLVSWWPGDGDANDIEDGHNGTLNGATFGPGEVGDAFSFDGTDDTVSIPDSTDWNFGTGEFTFDFWARSSSSSTARMYALDFAPVALQQSLDFDFNEGIGLVVFWNGNGSNPGTDSIYVGTPGQYTDGKWHHYALTRSGSTWTLYIDGAVAGTATYSQALDLSGGSNHQLGAFFLSGSEHNFWNGQIDEVEIFNRALTADEVAAIYHAAGAGKCKDVITLSASPPAGGTVSGGGTRGAGSTATVVATPNSCYQFVNWTENNNVVSTSPSYSFTVTADRTLVANFSIKTFTISASASPSSGGSVSGAGNYDCGSQVNLTAIPADCFNFVNWTENGNVVSTSATYSFTAGANRTLVANFSAANCPTPTISLSASTNQINEGQSATFTFSASPVPHKPVNVIYMMKGSAARNTDYTLSGTPLMVTIPANQVSATVVLHAIEDNGKREKKEQVTMTISKSSSYKIGKPNQASVQINDD